MLSTLGRAGTVVLCFGLLISAGGKTKSPDPAGGVGAPWVATTSPEPQNNPCTGAGSAYLSNGQVHLERLDLEVPGRGGLNFAFQRTYKSYVQYNGPLGFGWQHNYDMRMTRSDASTLQWLTGADRVETFTQQADGTYRAAGGIFAIALGDDSGFTVREADGTRYVFNSLSDPLAPGSLAQVRDPHGNRLLMQYGSSGPENRQARPSSR